MKRDQTALSLGVIGVGSMGQHHARIIASLPEVHFVGVADTNVDRATDVANRYNVKYFQDYRSLLNLVDAVIIATPTNSHYTIGKECLRRRIHVLIEKPIANNVIQANDLANMIENQELVLQVGHVERFNPTFNELTRVLAHEKILAIQGRRLSPFIERVANTSVVFDLMVHDIDLALGLMDTKVESLNAMGIRANTMTLDHVSANLVFENGVMANLIASKISQQKVREIIVICEKSVIQANFLGRTIVAHRQTKADFRVEDAHMSYRQEALVEQVFVPSVEPLYAELADFIDCIRNCRTPIVGPRQAIKVMRLAEAIEKAAQDF